METAYSLIPAETVRQFYTLCLEKLGKAVGPVAGTIGPIGAIALILFFVSSFRMIAAIRKRKSSVAGLIISIFEIILSAAWWYLWVYSAGGRFFYRTTVTSMMATAIFMCAVGLASAIFCARHPKAKAVPEGIPEKFESGEPESTQREIEQTHLETTQIQEQLTQIQEQLAQIHEQLAQIQQYPIADYSKEQLPEGAPQEVESEELANAREEIEQLRQEIARMRQQKTVSLSKEQASENQGSAPAVPFSLDPPQSENNTDVPVPAAEGSSNTAVPAKSKLWLLLILDIVLFAFYAIENVSFYGTPLKILELAISISIALAFFARKSKICMGLSGIIALFWLFTSAHSVGAYSIPLVLLVYLGSLIYTSRRQGIKGQTAELTKKLSNTSSGYSYLDEYKKNMTEKK